MKILIADTKEALGGNAEWQKKYLEEKLPDAEVSIFYDYGNMKELYKASKDIDGLLTAFLNMDEAFLKNSKNLEAVSISAVGYNTIDLQQAKKQKITVMNLGEYCTEEVADHTISLWLALTRRLKEYDQNMLHGEQREYILQQPIRRIRGQKLGIFGFGRIGQAVAQRAKAFGVQVYVYQNPNHPVKEMEGIKLASAEEIFTTCDIITNHMPQSKENYHFFSKEAFQKMNRCPVFINTGRGDAVDEEALKEALENNWIQAAGLDVLESETPDMEKYQWLDRENVIITPHAAFYSQESIDALKKTSCDNLIYFFKNQKEKISNRII